MEQRDRRYFRELVELGRKQLAYIESRLSGTGGMWSEMAFRRRHTRIKRIFADILARREAKTGDGAVLELIDDLKSMETDSGEWCDVVKEEVDYLRFVLHGIREAASDESRGDEKNGDK